VDLSDFKPAPPDAQVRRELKIPDGRKIVLKIANFAPWKGQDVLLDAAEILTARGVDAQYVFAGRDTDGDDMRRLVEKRNLSDRVTCAGFRKDVPKLISIANVGVNSAVGGEGLSGALRESLAMEIPVVATDTAGNRELVKDSETGLLCPASDAAALADKIAWTLEHVGESAKMAQAGHAFVLREFSTEKSIADTHALYEKVIASRRLPT
jgi:glycosyltransferase involved in cell wall biosynthesis